MFPGVTMNAKIERVMALWHDQFGVESGPEADKRSRRYAQAEAKLCNADRIAFYRARHAQAGTLREAEHCQRMIQIESCGFLTRQQASGLAGALRALGIVAKPMPYTNLVVEDAEAEANATRFRVVGKGEDGVEYVYREEADIAAVFRRIGRGMGLDITQADALGFLVK